MAATVQTALAVLRDINWYGWRKRRRPAAARVARVARVAKAEGDEVA